MSETRFVKVVNGLGVSHMIPRTNLESFKENASYLRRAYSSALSLTPSMREEKVKQFTIVTIEDTDWVPPWENTSDSRQYETKITRYYDCIMPPTGFSKTSEMETEES